MKKEKIGQIVYKRRCFGTIQCFLQSYQNIVLWKVRQKIMKTLNDYMAMNYRMEIAENREEGGYVVSYPELPGCIASGDTVECATANALDAKKAWFEAAIEDGSEIREPESFKNYSGQFKLRLPRSLHQSLAEHSRREGISMNQYCVYLLSRSDAVHSK